MTDENLSFDVLRDEYHQIKVSQWNPTEEKKRADHSGLFSNSADCQNGSVPLFTVPPGFYGIITFLYYENMDDSDPQSLLTISDGTGVKWQEVTKYYHKQLVQRGDCGWMVLGPVTIASAGNDAYTVNATWYLVPI